MPNAEECRWETRGRGAPERARRAPQAALQGLWLVGPAWLGRRTVTFFEEVWVTVTVTVREWVCTAVEVAEVDRVRHTRLGVARVRCRSLGRRPHRQRYRLLADYRRRSCA